MAAFCNVDMGVGEYAKAMTFSTWKRIVSDISTMPETEQSADLTSSGQGFLQV